MNGERRASCIALGGVPAMRVAARVCCALTVMVAASCATRTVRPPAAGAPLHPEFVFPAVPSELQSLPGAESVDLGWRLLQRGDLTGADRVFASALRQTPRLFPARTGDAYVALARRDYDRALTAFDASLASAGRYAPALVGRGQTLLALSRDDEALAAFGAALASDPSLGLGARIEALRFRTVQRGIESARAAASAGRLDEARAAYEGVLASSPESAFLHLELGLLERRAGRGDAALSRLRRASDLDPSDVRAPVQMAELLAERQDFAGAEAAYRRAAAIEPSEELAARISAAADRARLARLPPEFRAIQGSAQITRGDLAALVGERLADLIASSPATPVVITDAGSHWAAAWITRVAGAGLIEPFENHTFQPRSRVLRGDLAAAAGRVVALVASADAGLRAKLAERPKVADVPPGHRLYAAVSASLASGAMPLVEGGRFDVNRPVTGAEAVDTVERLRALASALRTSARP